MCLQFVEMRVKEILIVALKIFIQIYFWSNKISTTDIWLSLSQGDDYVRKSFSYCRYVLQILWLH